MDTTYEETEALEATSGGESVCQNHEAVEPYDPEDLMGLAKKYVEQFKGLPDDVREDVESEFVLAAFEAGTNSDGGQNMRVYQHKAGEWSAARFLRKWNKNNATFPVSIDFDAESEFAFDEDIQVESEDNVFAEILNQEGSNKLIEAIKRLPEPLGVIIEKCYFEDWTFRQIASYLQCCVSNVAKQHAEALRILKIYLVENSQVKPCELN